MNEKVEYFLFKLQRRDDSIELKIEGSDSTIPTLLEHFENFLRGCGYAVDMQSLDVVEKNNDSN